MKTRICAAPAVKGLKGLYDIKLLLNATFQYELAKIKSLWKIHFLGDKLKK